MGCGCNKAAAGDWEIVNADGTVEPAAYATSMLAQAALVSRGGGGFIRQKQRQNA